MATMVTSGVYNREILTIFLRLFTVRLLVFFISTIVIIASMRLLAQSYDPIKIKITIDFITPSEITSNRLIARSLERRIIEVCE